MVQLALLSTPPIVHLSFSNRQRPSVRLAPPALIFQGRQDESVSPAIVEKFARAQPDATLHLLDDGHQLKDSLDVMWRATSRFLSLGGPH